jgi:hypothetical protein
LAINPGYTRCPGPNPQGGGFECNRLFATAIVELILLNYH